MTVIPLPRLRVRLSARGQPVCGTHDCPAPIGHIGTDGGRRYLAVGRRWRRGDDGVWRHHGRPPTHNHIKDGELVSLTVRTPAVFECPRCSAAQLAERETLRIHADYSG